MAFEESLRQRISGFPYGSPERNLLKLVLGELQQKATVTDEIAHSIVKKIINGNEEVMAMVDGDGKLLLAEDDSRRAQYTRENELLAELLPKYLTVAQIRQSLEISGIDLKSDEKDGKAIGKAIEHFNKLAFPFEGQTVKDVVVEMRNS